MKSRILFFLFCCAFILTCGTKGPPTIEKSNVPTEGPIIVGAEKVNSYLPHILGKRIGLLINHTSLVGEQLLLDTLLSYGVQVVRVFTPEHGFRGR